jgi:hypothetical protein
MQIIGATGIGFVWGWLIGSAVVGTSKPRLNCYWISGTTIFVALVILLLAGWHASVAFPGAAGITLWLHHRWLRTLRSRFERTTKL